MSWTIWDRLSAALRAFRDPGLLLPPPIVNGARPVAPAPFADLPEEAPGDEPPLVQPGVFRVLRLAGGHVTGVLYTGTSGAAARQIYERSSPAPGQSVEIMDGSVVRGRKVSLPDRLGS